MVRCVDCINLNYYVNSSEKKAVLMCITKLNTTIFYYYMHLLRKFIIFSLSLIFAYNYYIIKSNNYKYHLGDKV